MRDPLRFQLPEKFDLPTYIDSSMMGEFGICRRKYAWRYIWNLIPKRTKSALTGGQAIHKGLEGVYLAEIAGKDIGEKAYIGMDSVAKYIGSMPPEEQEELLNDSIRTPENLMKAISDYVYFYSDDMVRPHADGIEKGFAVSVGNRPFTWVGRIDLIGGYTNSRHIIGTEHKHTTRMGEQYWMQWDPNFQIDSYFWALSEILQDFWGLILNVIVIHKKEIKDKKEMFHRQIIRRNRLQIENFYLDLMNALDDLEEAFRKGAKAFWMNRKACLAWYVPCPYRTLCLTSTESMLRNAIEVDYRVEKWSPYEELVLGDGIEAENGV